MGNQKYRSKFESEVAKKLPKRAKYESEVLDYVLLKSYLPDFVITHGRGKKVYIEAKGRFRNNDQQKLKAVKKQHPDKRIVLVFQNPDVLVRKGAKTTVSQWAERNGFEWYSLNNLPKRW